MHHCLGATEKNLAGGESSQHNPSPKDKRGIDPNHNTISSQDSIEVNSNLRPGKKKYPIHSAANVLPSKPYSLLKSPKTSASNSASSSKIIMEKNDFKNNPFWFPLTAGVRKLSLNLNWHNSVKAEHHFRTHKKEFPEYKNQDEYVLAAIRFWEKPILLPSNGQPADLSEKRGTHEPSSDESDESEPNTHKIYRYERSSGILSSICMDPVNPGEILLTFFKPRWERKDRLTKSLKYYLDQ